LQTSTYALMHSDCLRLRKQHSGLELGLESLFNTLLELKRARIRVGDALERFFSIFSAVLIKLAEMLFWSPSYSDLVHAMHLKHLMSV